MSQNVCVRHDVRLHTLCANVKMLLKTVSCQEVLLWDMIWDSRAGRSGVSPSHMCNTCMRACVRTRKQVMSHGHLHWTRSLSYQAEVNHVDAIEEISTFVMTVTCSEHAPCKIRQRLSRRRNQGKKYFCHHSDLHWTHCAWFFQAKVNYVDAILGTDIKVSFRGLP